MALDAVRRQVQVRDRRAVDVFLVGLLVELLAAAEELGAEMPVFRPGEHVKGAAPAVIITHGLWQRRFGADPAILGRAIELEGVPFTVIGILPREFAPQILPRPGELSVWTPKVLQEHERRVRGSAWWNVVARLRSGVTVAEAQSEMAWIAATLATEHPRTNAGTSVQVVPLREHLAGHVRLPLLLMLAALFLLGVWACEVTGRAIGAHDHGGMVWDEMVAFLLVLFFVPATLAWQATAFLLFRLLDILKPQPIRYYERTFRNGFGVMLDDFVAAFYTLIVLAIATRLLG